MQTTKNRKFPLGNSLLYISLLFVVFGRVRPQGAPCFLFCFTPDDFNGTFLWEELCQIDTIPPQQLMRINR